MLRFLRMLLALAAVPFAAGLAWSFFALVLRVPAAGEAFCPPELLALLGGFVAFLAAWIVFPKPVRAYVLGHELTHALWGLLFGARVGNLRVGLRGGSVGVSKSNVWITLAPYFFPFYTALVLLAALALRGVLACARGTFGLSPFACRFGEASLPWPGLWFFLVGFTWCFHVAFTLRALSQHQPDVAEYGRIFSWTFIWVMNFALMILGLACVTGVGFREVFAVVASCCARPYAFLYESLRALPFLRG